MSEMFKKPVDDTKLRILQDLYEDERNLDGLDVDEPGLGEEVEIMRETKALLDARPRMRPSTHAFQAVLAAAAEASLPAAPRRDRAPVARRSAVYLRVGAVSAVVVVLLSVLTLLRLDFRNAVPIAGEQSNELMIPETVPDRSDELEQATNAAAPEPAPAQDFRDESLARGAAAVAPAHRHTAFATRRDDGEAVVNDPQMALAAEMEAQADYADMLAWDHSGEVIEVYQDIEMVGGGVDLGWEPPSVPLELLPQSRPSRRSVQPAVQR